MSRIQDAASVLRGLRMVLNSGLKYKQEHFNIFWENSSVKLIIRDAKLGFYKTQIKPELLSIPEAIDRISTVVNGIIAYQTQVNRQPIKDVQNPNDSTKNSPNIEHLEYEIKLTERDKELLRKLDMDHQEKMKAQQNEPKVETKTLKEEKQTKKEKKLPEPLGEGSKQRAVPSSRIGRMVSFGSLAAGLGIGTISEFVKRGVGLSQNNSENALFLSPANLDRIVDTLCKVRGAALKIGQIMSIQDDSVIHPELAKALERVRKSADFMPNWQVQAVMETELGPDWRSKFSEFQEKPFAAASIGQVHLGKTLDGQEVAIKIQYPGVAKGINSDIDNLVGIMNLWNIFPKGMFVENLVTVAKRELAWEVDYKREAECTKKFRQLLEPYPEYYVPQVIDDLCGNQIFTSELLDGVPVDQCFNMDEEHKKFIGFEILKLCLLEILEFRYMQTDPNWANFLYNPNKKQMLLIDFGASREYSEEFMLKYVQILKAAYDNDRKAIEVLSGELGFFTGYESQLMVDAHVDAVLILGEMFNVDEYDFGAQNLTQRIQNLVPTMINHRLCPPPEEVYSLHRKLSGVFLLCSKLKVPLRCRDLFVKLYNEHELKRAQR